MSHKNISIHVTVVAFFALIFMVGCAQNYPTHIVYSDTADGSGVSTGINSYQFNVNTGPRYSQASAATKEGDVGDKSGESTRHSILFGLAEWGNNGAGTAAQNGGVRSVKTVQNNGIDVLWGVIYSEQSTIVTGDSSAQPGNKTASTTGTSKREKPTILINPDDAEQKLVALPQKSN
jgi:hypothetical protein